MLRTKRPVSRIAEVPSQWIMEYYLDLPERLEGQDLMIKSIFNSKDEYPSFHIYYNISKGRYCFKDFSTGESGDGVDLIGILHSLDTKHAMFKVIDDYNNYVLEGGDQNRKDLKVHEKFRVSGFVKRPWNTLDKNYWLQYGIGSSRLAEYNVCPLESYTMSKSEDGETKEININSYYIYGYFRSDGMLYKIYQPKILDKKFIKVRDYIQGTDQLKFNKPYLIITKALKDIICVRNLEFNCEVISPDSENTLISEPSICAYKMKYKGIVTLFDQDDPGVGAMNRYQEKYNIPGIVCPLEKDVSDSIVVHGIDKVRTSLYPLLKDKLINHSKLELV